MKVPLLQMSFALLLSLRFVVVFCPLALPSSGEPPAYFHFDDIPKPFGDCHSSSRLHVHAHALSLAQRLKSISTKEEELSHIDDPVIPNESSAVKRA